MNNHSSGRTTDDPLNKPWFKPQICLFLLQTAKYPDSSTHVSSVAPNQPPYHESIQSTDSAPLAVKNAVCETRWVAGSRREAQKTFLNRYRLMWSVLAFVFRVKMLTNSSPMEIGPKNDQSSPRSSTILSMKLLF